MQLHSCNLRYEVLEIYVVMNPKWHPTKERHGPSLSTALGANRNNNNNNQKFFQVYVLSCNLYTSFGPAWQSLFIPRIFILSINIKDSNSEELRDK